jgi:hypothetical protein
MHRIAGVLSAGLLLLTATPAAAQHAAFPWHAGDRPPHLAGFWLGQSMDSARRALPRTVRVDTLGSHPEYAYGYTTADRALVLVGMNSEGVGIITVRRRDLGAIDGVRVGDSCQAVLAHWGPPTTGDSETAMWVAGSWLVSARCANGVVSELSVGNVG